MITAIIVAIIIVIIISRMRLRTRRNTKRYGPVRVSRKGYGWRRVSVNLPFFRALDLWKKGK